MSHQDQNGTATGIEAQEPDAFPWRRAEDEPDKAGAPATEVGALRSAAPSPREQWFGGDAPPPPPYAAPIPPEAPTPPTGTSDPVRVSEPVEEPEPVEADEPAGTPEPAKEPGPAEEEPAPPAATGEAAADGDGDEDEARSDTAGLMPRPRERPARPLRRPARPGQGGGTDPLAPRDLRRDADVPEPEQLPPLEPEEATAPEPTDPPAPPAAPREPLSAPPEPPAPSAEPTAPPSAPPAPDTATADLSVQAVRHPGPNDGQQTADSLNAATLVRNRRQGPSGGWRRAVHTATLGLINPGESPKVLRRRELIARACTPVAAGHHRVAVLSLKGGVGKTTTTVALGATLASLRGDRVLAVDANPDRGTLSDKVRLETAATIRDLLNERHLVSRYADIRGFTSQAPSRLEILASDRDPAVSEAFGDEDYREVARLVEHFYSICITDCGTGLLHAAMRGVLGLADQVVLVSSASVDGARSASATLDWLQAHGHENLVRDASVVLSMVRSDSKSSVDLDRLESHFASRCRAVIRVPWDGHLEEGAEVDLDRLAPATRDAYLRLAATVGEGFARQG